MVELYNTTNLTAALNPLEATIAINQLTNDLLAYGTLISIWLILLIIFTRKDTKIIPAITTSSAITTF